MITDQKLTRREIRSVLKRHRGASALIARELDVDQTNISEWLRGRLTSKRVEDAIRQRVAELLAGEGDAIGTVGANSRR
jgi:hypothetical protein